MRTVTFLPITLVFQDNILVDQDCNARLADFGLVAVSDSTTIPSRGGTFRWMSPELLDPETLDIKTCHRTKSSDCYALGMVIYEILSGNAPFHQCGKRSVIWRVLEGGRPERPEGGWFTDEIWSILERCWEREPGDRPSINCVLQCLEEASGTWTPSLSSISEVPRAALSTWSHSHLDSGEKTAAPSGQPSESTQDTSSEPVG